MEREMLDKRKALAASDQITLAAQAGQAAKLAEFGQNAAASALPRVCIMMGQAPFRIVLRRCWQTNANQSPHRRRKASLFRAETAPLVESGGTVLLEDGAGREVAFLVEEIVDRGVDGGEQL